MRKIIGIVAIALALGIGALHGAPSEVPVENSSLYVEVNAFNDAIEETQLVYWSHLMTAFTLAVVTLIGIFTLLNIRTLAYAGFILYGSLILNIPYYVPVTFQRVFGVATIIIGILGLIIKLVSLIDTKSKKKPSAHPHA